MARSYATVATAIWRDDEFRLLSMAAQHAYLLLMSQPDISAAGVLSLNLTRWAARTKDVTRSSLRAALEELEAHRFVVADEETEELLVRSFVRWDNGYSNPKRRPVIRDAARQIESAALRRALATEFERLDLPTDWIPTFPQVDSQSDSQSDSHADGVSASERVVVTTALVVATPSLTPHSTTLVPLGSAEPRVAAPKRGTRIPDDFHVTAEMVAWAHEKTPGIEGRYETEKFIDYWRAKSGQAATKVDWPATWRGWMRRAHEKAIPATSRPSTADQRAGDAYALSQRFAEEDQP